MKFEKRLLSKLNYANYNLRKSLKAGDPEFEKIRRSIQEFGYVDVIKKRWEEHTKLKSVKVT